jgi:hypothetical protein
MATKLNFTGDNLVWSNSLELASVDPNLVTDSTQIPAIEPRSYYYEDSTAESANFGKSGKFKPDIRHPQNPSSSSTRLRVEAQFRNTIHRTARKIRWSISIFIPITTNILKIGTTTWMQWHAGQSIDPSSPSWRIDTNYIESLDKFTFEIVMRFGSGASLNWMRATIGEATKGVWHHFIVDHFFHPTYEPSNPEATNGSSVVWYNGNIARLLNRNTLLPFVIPETQSSQDEAGPSKGKFLRERDIFGNASSPTNNSVFIYEGKTVYGDGYNIDLKYIKFGIMNSVISGENWYPSSPTPRTLRNTTDPEAPYYVDLDLYGYGKLDFYIDNMNWDVSEDPDWQWMSRISYNRSQPNEFHQAYIQVPVDPFLVNLIARLESGASGGGTVTDLTGTSPYAEGENVMIQAVADSGYTFLRWENSGVSISTSATFVFTVPADNSVLVAVFRNDNPTPVVGGKFPARKPTIIV